MALLLIGGAGFAYWRIGSELQRISFLTVPVSNGNVRQVVSSTGTLQAVTSPSSRQPGFRHDRQAHRRLQYQGERQGRWSPSSNQDKFKAAVEESRANVLAAQANLAKAKVSVEDAERTLKRTAELRSGELIAQSEFDAAQTAYDAARSQVNVKQAQVIKPKPR